MQRWVLNDDNFHRMVLVASVAASVPIGTANQLREQATQTGVDASTAGNRDRPEICHRSRLWRYNGRVVDGDPGHSDRWYMTITQKVKNFTRVGSDSKETLQKIRDSATALGTWVASRLLCRPHLDTPGIRDATSTSPTRPEMYLVKSRWCKREQENQENVSLLSVTQASHPVK